MERLALQVSFLSITLILVVLIFRNYQESMKKRLMIVLFGIPLVVSLLFFFLSFSISKSNQTFYSAELLFFNSLSLFALVTITIYYILKDENRDPKRYLVFIISTMLGVPFLSSIANIYAVTSHLSDFVNPIDRDIIESGTSWVFSNIFLGVLAALIGGAIVDIINQKTK